ncbi:hypothetical protein THAR02_10716 [Trichoderma harzianum]|uniref:Uncharacterized protein n=1 Tax=Trichoderma harzianum TaxID=5544 RepID=A0A0F9Z9B4_TRIHA|nr:hypothetical protein THAR02_10716 [Trichoderma harzianum]
MVEAKKADEPRWDSDAGRELERSGLLSQSPVAVKTQTQAQAGVLLFLVPFFPSFLFLMLLLLAPLPCMQRGTAWSTKGIEANDRPARQAKRAGSPRGRRLGCRCGDAWSVAGCSARLLLASGPSCQGQVLARLQALLQGTAVVLAATPALAAAQMLHPPGQGLRAVNGLKTTVVGLDSRHVTARAF